jgi:hypothetical protein
METEKKIKNQVLERFNDFFNETNKNEAFEISREILTCLTSINFYNRTPAKSKKEYEVMFDNYIYTLGVSRVNPNEHFATQIRDDVDRILD